MSCTKIKSFSYGFHYFLFHMSDDEIDFLDLDLILLDGKRISCQLSINSKKEALLDLDCVSGPVKSILFTSEGVLVDEEVKEIFFDLYPLDNKAYESFFIREVQRVPRKDIQFFLAYQISKYFTGSVCYKIGATVILSYKAIELNNQMFLDVAKNMINKSLEILPQCKLDWHPRRNREHLKFSLLCAAYHVALARSDKTSFEEVLNEVSLSYKEVSNYFTPSYPISLSLLLKVVVSYIGGDEEINEKVNDVEYVFKRAVEDANLDKITLFEELKVAHASCVLAKKITQNKISISDAFSHAVRVKGKYRDNLLGKFLSMYNIEAE